MRLLALPLTIAALAMPSMAQAEMTPEQKKEVEALVREYILQNGDVLIESVNNFQRKQEEEANKQSAVKAKELIQSLKSEKNLAIAGNPDGDVTVVEFFDFNCGYCKKAFNEIQSLIKDDKNVKVVLYDMPILGPESVEAARWALAAKKQDKYFEYHAAIMNHNGPKNADVYKKLADDAGLDPEKLAKDKDAPEVQEEIKTHLAMAADLGIQGTPGFLIDETIFRGYIPYAAMQKAIADARSASKAE